MPDAVNPLRFAWILLAAPALGQTTWYVDPAGTPPYDGTPAHPYVEIQAAIDAPTTLDGDTILVAPGTYAEELELSAAVTLRGSGGPLVTILRPPTAAATGVTMTASGTLEGFTIERGTLTPSGTGVSIPFGALGRLVRCIVVGHQFGIDNRYDALIEECVFGDGLRCIAASGLVRIGAVLASGGTSLHTISHGAGTFHYQLWTRSTPSTFCDAAAAFNLSNALELAWP